MQELTQNDLESALDELRGQTEEESKDQLESDFEKVIDSGIVLLPPLKKKVAELLISTLSKPQYYKLVKVVGGWKIEKLDSIC